MVSRNRPYEGASMNLPPVGTRMCTSSGFCYEIVEYDGYENVIVVLKKGSRMRWHISAIKLDTVLTPLTEALI